MRSTSATAIILTLIMFLLVLAAAFVFLFQGRQTLAGQREELATALVGLEITRAQLDLAFQSAEATRLSTAEELATAVAEKVSLEGQLVASDQQIDILTATVAAFAATPATPTATPASSGPSPQTAVLSPEIRIVLPLTDTVLTVGDIVEIVFIVADPAGIATVNLLINGETQTYDPADVTLFTVQETWTATEAGEVQISVLAVNVNGRAADPVTITLPISAPDPDTQSSLGRLDANTTLRAEIEANVARIRGLEPTTAVFPTLLTAAEVRQRVEGDLLAEYTAVDAQKDTVVYAVFDFLPRDFDLYTFIRDLYSEQIAGFYDPETDEFVVVSEDGELGANEQLIHAHEFMHALQDQHFNLDLINDDTLDADASAALRALAEGEATLLQTLYIVEGYIDLAQLLASMEGQQTPVLDGAPPVLANSLVFPYTAGLEFAQTLYRQGGFAALDAAWENIPQSTEQILHPERYLAGDAPQLVALPPLTETLGAGWALADEDVLGEFMLREYLGQQLNRTQVNTAATGWGGDRYAVYANETAHTLLMVLRVVWDTDADATEFAALYPNYPAALFDTDGQMQGNGGECWHGVAEVICLFQSRRETTIVRAPDLGTAVEVIARVHSEN